MFAQIEFFPKPNKLVPEGNRLGDWTTCDLFKTLVRSKSLRPEILAVGILLRYNYWLMET